jgi:hypothetical protein
VYISYESPSHWSNAPSTYIPELVGVGHEGLVAEERLQRRRQRVVVRGELRERLCKAKNYSRSLVS